MSGATLYVRPMADGDEDGVVQLWQDCGLTRPWNDPSSDIAFARGKPASDVLVGERDGSLVATAMVGHDGHRGTVYYLGVRPEQQGTGTGREMMRAVEAWLRERGVWKLNLVVRTENSAVLAFYERLGYTIEDRVNLARRLDD